MKIIDIYQKFLIPPNLQEHMLKVCSIVKYLQQHWNKNIVVCWELTKKTALLHDLGNIVKFDFIKHPELLGNEQKNIDHWIKIQADIINKYGSDDHKATKKMLKELNIDKKSIELILNKSFENSIKIKNSDDWALKILYYADLRMLPFGIGSLEDRITDIKNRIPKYANKPNFEKLVDSCREIDKQIQQNIDVNVSEINEINICLNKSFLDLTI